MPHRTAPRVAPAGALPLVLLVTLMLVLSAAVPALAETATTGTDTTAAGVETTAAPEGAAPETTGAVVPRAPEAEQLNPGVSFDRVGVQVWPEYDEPDILVMVDVLLPEDATFPFTFRFAVPKGARVTGVAEVRADGSFDYSRPAPQFDYSSPDRDVVTVVVPKLRDVRLEYYYDPGLNLQGQRDFGFTYELPGDAKQASLSIQQPLRASGFAVQPPLSQSSSDQQGFSYVGESFEGLEGGDRLQAQVSYSRDTAEPSKPAGSTGAPASGASSSYLLLLLAIVIVGVGGFAAYRMWLRPPPATYSRGGGRRPAAKTARAPQNRARGSKPAANSRAAGKTGAAGGPSRFCTSCGSQLTKKDRFCPQCGEPRED
jgi:hypothetical protein